MTIEKGQPWGVSSIVPHVVIAAATDSALACAQPDVPVVLTGGDMYVAIGKPAIAVPGEQRTRVMIDALRCEIQTGNKTTHVMAASSIVIGHWLPRTMRMNRFICITNPGIFRNTHIAPRAHPNDGVFDVVVMSENMSWRQRMMSRRRARTGTHLPHPEIAVERAVHYSQEVAYSAEALTIDGHRITSWKTISIDIVPDYWQVFV